MLDMKRPALGLAAMLSSVFLLSPGSAEEPATVAACNEAAESCAIPDACSLHDICATQEDCSTVQCWRVITSVSLPYDAKVTSTTNCRQLGGVNLVCVTASASASGSTGCGPGTDPCWRLAHSVSGSSLAGTSGWAYTNAVEAGLPTAVCAWEISASTCPGTQAIDVRRPSGLNCVVTTGQAFAIGLLSPIVQDEADC